jgi:hypothetical protein
MIHLDFWTLQMYSGAATSFPHFLNTDGIRIAMGGFQDVLMTIMTGTDITLDSKHLAWGSILV